MKRIYFFLIITIMLISSLTAHAQTGGIYRATFESDGVFLTIEILDDDLAHFELGDSANPDEPLWTSPMVAKTDYVGASELELPSKNEIVTPDMRLVVDGEALCVTIFDRTYDPELTLTTLCPNINETDIIGLTFSAEGTTDIYGLGEQFRRRGGTDGNWMGNRRVMLNQYGNSLTPFNGGNVGSAQFPILYALGADTQNYALFVDHAYQQYWAFNADPFIMQTSGAPIRWYVMTGENVRDLRSDYLELTGTPPVPPRQLFGLWVSEYGYDNWDELKGVLDSLRDANFPVDGFVLDLQWFGGINAPSQMGSLMWDADNFPSAQAIIAHLREQYGVGIMTIEESYVSETAIGYDEAVENDVLVKKCETCPPVIMNEWWGRGGMVDWSNPQASAWWHDNRRQHLIDAGVMAHWTDLGEPENYDESAWYFGIAGTNRHGHAGIHNLYNLLWSQSIWDGYARNDVALRPFILSRSGTSGSQRYGVAMWSGDIGANLMSLSEHMNAQLHLSLSGMDYFGADIGGFFRQSGDPLFDEDTMYSVWLANGALLDVPMRPHTVNLQNRYDTAPSLVGDVTSNLANVRLRYELSPYLYTLAHNAYLTGEAVFPPLVYHFQTDQTVREMGNQKMIGDQLMMATLTDYDPQTTSVYLPAGGWFNYHTGEFIESVGETIEISAPENIIQAPLFARDGAIIPVMRVDDNTLNMLGERANGEIDTTLALNIYHASTDNTFTYIEDDGVTTAYRDGAIRQTTISTHTDGEALSIEIGAGIGTFDGASDERAIEIRLNAPNREAEVIRLNGEILPPLAENGAGWMRLESGVILIRTGAQSVNDTQIITIEPIITAHAKPISQDELVMPLYLAHYMPWYQTPSISGRWGWHWTMNHFNPNHVDENNRPEIASQFMPLTGPYDSHDPNILEYQVLLMKLSGIDGVIVDWYGTADYNDYAMLNSATTDLFAVIEKAGMKFVICYEDRTLRAMVNDGHLDVTTAIEQGKKDIQFANEQWFGSDAYVKHNGQPLLFVFGPIYFRQASDWEAIFGDIIPAPALVTLDNSLSFIAAGSYPWPPMNLSGGVELYPEVLAGYLDLFYRNARRSDMIIGSAFPGFFDIYEQAGERSSYGFLDARDGQTLRDTLARATEANAQIVQLVTWNDYGEGTMIEPTDEYGYTYLEIMQSVRREQDATFTPTAENLRLPMRLYEARLAYQGDDAVNIQLDTVFEAIINGDFASATAILDTLMP